MRPVRRNLILSVLFATGLAFAFSPSAVANPDGEAQRPLANRLWPANMDRVAFFGVRELCSRFYGPADPPKLFLGAAPSDFEGAGFSSSYAYRFTTSSILVPKSFNITTAAFLPGPPVTEPPGCVVAPV